MEVKDGDPEVHENEKKEASAAAKAEKDQEQFENTIILVATLFITLTYQGLANPPSTLFKQGTEIQWGCLFDKKKRYGGLINSLKTCPTGLTLAFLIINTFFFLDSIFLLVLTMRGRRMLLLGLLTILLTVNSSILLVAFSNYTAYFAIPLACLAIIRLYFIILKDHGVRAMIHRVRRNPLNFLSEYRKFIKLK